MAATAPATELEVRGRTVRVTSADRVVFPKLGITKLEVVEYFVAVGDGILGALLHRPTTLERWPKGVFEGAVMATRADNRGDAFYQKRVPQGAPDYVETATIAFPSGVPAGSRIAEMVISTSIRLPFWCWRFAPVRNSASPVTSWSRGS